jgi:hypothetical protein
MTAMQRGIAQFDDHHQPREHCAIVTRLFDQDRFSKVPAISHTYFESMRILEDAHGRTHTI